jgi:hypothetical protein
VGALSTQAENMVKPVQRICAPGKRNKSTATRDIAFIT